MNVLELAEKHDIKIHSVEPKDFGTVYRALSVKKLEAIRTDLLEGGHPTPISCHREEGGIDSFMIIWNK
jgi:hypothetical protein